MSGAQFWRMETPGGVFIMRRWPAEHPTPERLRFIHAVLFHAAERGITYLPVPIRTSNGESFVHFSGDLWEFAPWMPGVADYERSPNEEKLRAALSALARFHVAVRDFPCGANSPVAGATPAVSRRLTRLRDLVSNGASALSRQISGCIWPELASLAPKFLSMLPRCATLTLAQLEPIATVSLPLQPCLRDIWHDHVLFMNNEVTGIIDFGAVDIDAPATDIARLLGSLVGDDAEGWRHGIAAYSAVRKLTHEEEIAVRALDMSGTVLAGCNWLHWTCSEGRQFENRDQVAERFRRVVDRCKALLGEPMVVDDQQPPAPPGV
jgi:Ser/Thr protein kinase RdoA (MazF antagonist)